MKREAKRSETLEESRYTAVAALIAFCITFFVPLFLMNSSDSHTPEETPVSDCEWVEDIFCRVDVVAPSPYLQCGAPARRFAELRQETFAKVGFDFLATCGDMKRDKKARSSKPGVANNSRHKSGQAFDYNQEDGRLLLVREDIGGRTYWRTYLRCEKQDGTCGVRADLETENAGGVSAFVFDFTAAAESLGWRRIPAQSGWKNSHTKKEFWHYQMTEYAAIDKRESVGKTEPDGESNKQTSPITAPFRLLAALAGRLVKDKLQPPGDIVNSTLVTESRGNNGAAEKVKAVRPARRSRLKVVATQASSIVKSANRNEDARSVRRRQRRGRWKDSSGGEAD
jgi:hypothetical protein